MSTAGAQAAAPLASYCWPGRQPRPLAARIISSCAARRSSNRSQLVIGVMVVMWSLVLPCIWPGAGPGDPEEHRSGEHYSVPSYSVHCIVNSVHSQPEGRRDQRLTVLEYRCRLGPTLIAAAAVQAGGNRPVHAGRPAEVLEDANDNGRDIDLPRIGAMPGTGRIGTGIYPHKRGVRRIRLLITRGPGSGSSDVPAMAATAQEGCPRPTGDRRARACTTARSAFWSLAFQAAQPGRRGPGWQASSGSLFAFACNHPGRTAARPAQASVVLLPVRRVRISPMARSLRAKFR